MNRHTMLTICIWFDTVCTSLSFTFHQDNRSVILRYWLLLAAVIILFVIWAMNVRQLWICCCFITKRGNNEGKKTNFVDIILLKNFQFNFKLFFYKTTCENIFTFPKETQYLLLLYRMRCRRSGVYWVEIRKIERSIHKFDKKNFKLSIIRYFFCYASVHRWNRILSGSMRPKSSNVGQMFLLLLFALSYFILWYTFDASFRCFISICCIYPNFGHFLSLNISWNVADDLFSCVFFSAHTKYYQK